MFGHLTVVLKSFAKWNVVGTRLASFINNYGRVAERTWILLVGRNDEGFILNIGWINSVLELLRKDSFANLK